jgi:uncharacterized protein YuzE
MCGIHENTFPHNNLTGKPSVESIEVAPGIVVDMDENNSVAGIDIDNASKKLALDQVEIESLPAKILLHT